MAWNGTGTFEATDGVYTVPGICASQAGDGDAKIKASEMDAVLEDLSDGIHACLAKNGENSPTANIAFGGYKITGLGTPSANTDAGLHGNDLASGTYNGVSDQIVLTLNDGSTVTVDVSGLSAGTNGVSLTGDQTIAGVKTFTSATSLAEAKFDGPTKSLLAVPTPGSSVTINTTAANDHYVTVGQNTTVTFTWPTGSDTQLGANYTVKGEITFRHTGAGYTLSLNSTMLAALSHYSVEGAPATGSGDLSTLVYNYKYVNGTTVCQFAWVATP